MAALLSMAVLMGWQAIFPPPPLVEPEATEEAGLASSTDEAAPGRDAASSPLAGSANQDVTAGESVSVSAPDVPAVVADPINGSPGQQVELTTESWRAVFDSTGARLVSLTLLDRRRSSGDAIELVRRREDAQAYPFSIVDSGGQRLALDQAHFAVQ